MGVIISFGIQKGGVGKSTTTGISSYLLSKEYKVLAVDFDSQGNLTQLKKKKNIYCLLYVAGLYIYYFEV